MALSLGGSSVARSLIYWGAVLPSRKYQDVLWNMQKQNILNFTIFKFPLKCKSELCLKFVLFSFII